MESPGLQKSISLTPRNRRSEGEVYTEKIPRRDYAKQESEFKDTLKLEFFDIKEGNVLKKRRKSIELDRNGHEIAYIANNLTEGGKVDAFILVLTSTKRRPMTELVKFELDSQGDWFRS